MPTRRRHACMVCCLQYPAPASWLHPSHCLLSLLCRPRRGYVKLVFETAEGEQVHFMRLIVPSSASAESYSSQYKINDRAVTVDAYIKRLETYNILVKARNFLVFQVRLY